MIIGVEGFNTHPWPSVERTRKFYERALGSRFELRLIDPSTSLTEPEFDAMLGFVGNRMWRLPSHPDVPLLFAIHGGTTIGYEFLGQHLHNLSTCDTLIVNSTSDITILRRFFVDATPQFCHLPLPVDTTLFRPRDREECRSILPIEKVDHIVGYVGRLLPQRNLHHFLRLLANLKQRLTPQRVIGLVIGNYWMDYPVLRYGTDYPGYMGGLLRQLDLTEDVVYFPAKLSDDDLAHCYGAMDVLIHPTNSIDENFGYVPIEAMACGTPVVAAAYGGLKDTVQDNQTGFLMPTWITTTGIRMDLIKGRRDALRLLLDSDLRRRMSEAAVASIHTRYSHDVCAQILITAVEQAIQNQRQGLAQSIMTKPLPPTPPISGLLPPLERPWEYYQNGVADYVSVETPRISNQAVIQLTAPINNDGHGGYVLDDPAWPATFHLNPTEAALIEKCHEPVVAGELMHNDDDRESLQRLIDVGLLICSN